jgi:thiol:disulfide interchange protein
MFVKESMDTQQIRHDRGLVGPLMMILVGAIFLVHQFVPEIGFDKLWPLLLIACGVAALFGRR